jgi:hypothetical protein
LDGEGSSQLVIVVIRTRPSGVLYFAVVFLTHVGKIGKLSQLLRLRRGDKGEQQMGCSQSTAKDAVDETQPPGNK